MRRLFAFVMVALSFAGMTALHADAETRTALVIGNSAYQSSPLKNPVNDAGDIANILFESGFKVTLKLNATRAEMDRAVRAFGRELRDGGVGLFYYAGHGLQMEGRNYLTPVDAVIESESDVRYGAIDAGIVLGKMEDAANDLNIIILDACRNNPFARSFRSSFQGLARMDAPKGSLIAYATAPGSIAADGEGRNGIYTHYLIENIKKPGLTIEQILKNVRVAVVADTANMQVPWETSSLMGNFYFIRAPEQKPASYATDSIALTNDLRVELDRLKKERLELERLKTEIERQRIEQERIRIENEHTELLKKNTGTDISSNNNISNNRTGSTNTETASSEAAPLNAMASAHPDPVVPGDTQTKINTIDQQYIQHTNRIVHDKKTGLEWCLGPDSYHWDKAKKWAQTLDLDGGGWRLPSLKELQDLYTQKNEADTVTLLLKPDALNVWSNEDIDSFRVWYFSFKYGERHYAGLNTTQSMTTLAVRPRPFIEEQSQIDDSQPSPMSKDPDPVISTTATLLKDKGNMQGKDNEALTIVARDRHYVKFKNGIVFDENTGLEWFAGEDFNHWRKAKKWVETLSLDGGKWRIPSLKELKDLYKQRKGPETMTPLLASDALNVWSDGGEDGYWAWYFSFEYGNGNRTGIKSSYPKKAFAVRKRP